MHTEKAFEEYIKHIYGYCEGFLQYPFFREKNFLVFVRILRIREYLEVTCGYMALIVFNLKIRI